MSRRHRFDPRNTAIQDYLRDVGDVPVVRGTLAIVVVIDPHRENVAACHFTHADDPDVSPQSAQKILRLVLAASEDSAEK